jgi:hypothetical protein
MVRAVTWEQRITQVKVESVINLQLLINCLQLAGQYEHFCGIGLAWWQ